MQAACRLHYDVHAACMQPATSCMQDVATCNLLHTIVCRLHEACMKPACRLLPPACRLLPPASSLLQPATSCIRSYSQRVRQSAQLCVDADVQGVDACSSASTPCKMRSRESRDIINIISNRVVIEIRTFLSWMTLITSPSLERSVALPQSYISLMQK